jgi:hypothetical protein
MKATHDIVAISLMIVLWVIVYQSSVSNRNSNKLFEFKQNEVS